MDAAAEARMVAPPLVGNAGPERPRLRSDVLIRHQVLGGEVFYIVKNPDTGKYYRFREAEHDVLQLLDGESDPQQIAVRFSDAHPGKSISVSNVETFVDSLRDLDLIEKSPEQKRLALYERLRSERDRRRSPVKSLLFIKKKLYDPDHLFGGVLKVFWFFWTPRFARFSAALIVAAGLLVVLQWGTFYIEYGRFLAELTNPKNLGRSYYFLLFTWFWLTLVHETCHGVTCKYFGGEVREVGFLLFYLQFPGCYCNVNDAWSFPRRSQRLWVTLAGGYSGIVLAAVGVFVWWLAPPGGLLPKIAFGVILFGFLENVFFNFNPLLKFDGYYMLSDYLEVPNLQGNSWKHLGYLVRRHLFRLPVKPPPGSRRTRRIYAVYGVLSFLYISFIICFLLFLVEGWLHKRFGEAGLLPFGMVAILLLTRPARSVAASARFVFADKKAFLKSGRGAGTIGLGLVVLAALLFLPQLPVRVSGVGTVEPPIRRTLRAAAPGRIVEVTDALGTEVPAGHRVIRLSNPVLEAGAALAEARRREAAAELDDAKARGWPARAALLEARLERETNAADRARMQVGRLTVHAPSAGILDAPLLFHAQGWVIREGDYLGEILERGRVRVRLRVPERRVGDVALGDPVALKIAAYPARVFSGRVVDLLPERAPDDPQELEAAQRPHPLRAADAGGIHRPVVDALPRRENLALVDKRTPDAWFPRVRRRTSLPRLRGQ